MRVAIAGAGFSGTTLAVRLARMPGFEVTLFERQEFAAGPAYSTTYQSHLLNVRTEMMGAFAEDPKAFQTWLASKNPGSVISNFAERRLYGEYLQGLLRSVSVSKIRGEVLSAVRSEGAWRIESDSAPHLAADCLILALGNSAPQHLSALEPIKNSPRYLSDPWDYARLNKLDPAGDVLILGSGLTAIDAALALDESGHRGKFTLLSRHGLLPLTHAKADAAAFPALDTDSVGSILKKLRQYAQTVSWPAVIDWVRPDIQRIWVGLNEKERRRFLRHARPFWDIHRHRKAPQVEKQLARLADAGRMNVLPGRILGAKEGPDGIEVSFRLRGSQGISSSRFGAIINCTGPAPDLAKGGSALLQQLARDGIIRPGPLGLGIEATSAGAVIDASGKEQPDLFAVGTLIKGILWEIIAVPDLREQIRTIADTLSKK